MAEAWIPDEMLGKHTLISQKTCGVETITLAKPSCGKFPGSRVKRSFLLFTKGGPESVAVLTFLEVGMEGRDGKGTCVMILPTGDSVVIIVIITAGHYNPWIFEHLSGLVLVAQNSTINGMPTC